MQKVVIVGAALVLVSMLFAMSGPSAQRVGPGPEAVASKPPQPTVQEVTGTVNVGNLPAVQSVAGSVQVTNLPLDGDGNVRVVGIAPGPSYQWTQIAENVAMSPAAPATIGPFPVGGWRVARLTLRVTITSTNPTGFDMFANCGGDGLFTNCGTLFPALGFDPGAGTTQTFVVGGNVAIGGPDMIVRFQMNTGDPTGTAVVDQVWLYLSN